MPNQTFEKIGLTEGINLYLYPTDRFKTVYLTLFAHLPLDENTTTNALLSRILIRGCRKYPNMRKIAVFLESLYGAGFGSDVDKIGERHLLELHFTGVADRFLPQRAHTLEKGLLFLKQLIAEPLVHADGLLTDYVEQEKVNLHNEITGLKDDKIAYARQRCLETMCADEPYRLYEYGQVSDIEALNSQNLLERLRIIVGQAPLDIFIFGQFSPAKIAKSVRNIFALRRQTSLMVPPPALVNKTITKERVVRETIPETEQAKLVLGYRTYTTWQEEDIFPLMVFNGILGAYPHSKLFREVREVAGLAYYVSSALERTKGLMLINAGILPEKFEPAVNIIKEQLNEIRQGNVSGEELSSTVKSLDERLKSLRDAPSAFIGYTLEEYVNRRTDSLEVIREKIKSVTKDDVARIAQRVKLDTVYLLAPTVN